MSEASASFTLMDYTDSVSLITGIDSNLPFTSLYDTASQTLNPSWAGDTHLILTPRVLKAGSSASLVESMTDKMWKRRKAGGTWIDVVSGSNGESMDNDTGVLTISQNKLVGDVWQIEYKFSGDYMDPVVKVSMPVEMTVTFSRVANGTSFVLARAYAVSGTTFKNGQPEELTVKAELLRGATTDTTNITYTWQKSINGTDWTTVTGSTDTLSIKDVDSFAMFRCRITDADPDSDTYNQTYTTGGVAFYDVSDPYQAVIESTAGDVFKNGTGSTILICRLYQNGEEIDAKGDGDNTYTWSMTDKDGNAMTPFPCSPTATGSIVADNSKAIAVNADDVTVKATFFCEVN